MIEIRDTEKDVIGKRSLVLHEAMWNSIIRRSEKVILKNVQLLEVDQHYMNYLYEGSRTMANKLKTGGHKSHMKDENEEHAKIDRLKFNEFTDRFKESDGHYFNYMHNARMDEITEVGKNNLTLRKQDEYKRELRHFIENKRQIQMVKKAADSEQQRLERLKINSEMTEQLKKEQLILAKQKAAKKIIELESMQMLERTRQRKFKFFTIDLYIWSRYRI